jgi:hypothetical protein
MSPVNGTRASVNAAAQHGGSPLAIFFLLLALVGVTAVLAVRVAFAALSRSGEGQAAHPTVQELRRPRHPRSPRASVTFPWPPPPRQAQA